MLPDVGRLRPLALCGSGGFGGNAEGYPTGMDEID